MPELTITGNALVAGLQVRRQVIGTRLIAVQFGDWKLADLTSRAESVDVAQYFRRAADEAVVLFHAPA